MTTILRSSGSPITWNDVRYPPPWCLYRLSLRLGATLAEQWTVTLRYLGFLLFQCKPLALAALPPTLNFVGNSCSTAMNAGGNRQQYSPAWRGSADASSDSTKLARPANPKPLPDNCVPTVNRICVSSTLCDRAHQNDCSSADLQVGEGRMEAYAPASVGSLHPSFTVRRRTCGRLAAWLVLSAALQRHPGRAGRPDSLSVAGGAIRAPCCPGILESVAARPFRRQYAAIEMAKRCL